MEAIPDVLSGVVSQEEIRDLVGERLNDIGIKPKEGDEQLNEYKGASVSNDSESLRSFDRLSCSVAVVLAAIDVPGGKALSISFRAERGAFIYPGAYMLVTVDDHTRIATCGDGTHDFVLEQVRALTKKFEGDWRKANPR